MIDVKKLVVVVREMELISVVYVFLCQSNKNGDRITAAAAAL